MSAGTAIQETSRRRVVIYGREELACLASYCLRHDSAQEVVAFTVLRDELTAAERGGAGLLGLPLVPFETLEERFQPESHDLLVAIGPHDVNAPRAARYAEGVAKGYAFASYVASRAHTWPDLEIGPGCMIFDNVVIEPFARIGANAVLRANVHVSHDASIGDHAFLAPRVALAGKCSVGERSFLGINAAVRDGVAVAPRCVVGAGAVVARTTEPDGLYTGVPARRVGAAGDVKIWP